MSWSKMWKNSKQALVNVTEMAVNGTEFCNRLTQYGIKGLDLAETKITKRLEKSKAEAEEKSKEDPSKLNTGE